jgi:hypothetical protein
MRSPHRPRTCGGFCYLGGVIPFPVRQPWDSSARGRAQGRRTEQARRSAARAVNAVLTATSWEIGRRLVEFEQGGQARAEYGEALLKRLAQDLTARHGRGFGVVNLSLMRRFYLAWPAATILQTPSEKSDAVPAPAAPPAFPLPGSPYVRLLSVANPHARAFSEAEAGRCRDRRIAAGLPDGLQEGAEPGRGPLRHARQDVRGGVQRQPCGRVTQALASLALRAIPSTSARSCPDPRRRTTPPRACAPPLSGL